MTVSTTALRATAMSLRTLAAALLLALLAACSSILGVRDDRVEVGIIAWDRSAAALRSTGDALEVPSLSMPEPAPGLFAPDTVTAGEPFGLTVVTIGPNGCWREGGMTVERTETVVEMTPYDRFSGGRGIACTDMIAVLPRNLTLRFDAPGSATLRVRGRRVIGTDFDRTEPMLIEKTIHVR
jgi:hypothetical protein